jgi:hypothetical protein
MLQAVPPPVAPVIQGTVAQPGTIQPGVVLQPGVTVPNYLVFAILATVFCCLPTGIPAIIYAAQVNAKLQQGDLAGAQAASGNAKMWCWISFGAGLAVCAFSIMLSMLGVLASLHN